MFQNHHFPCAAGCLTLTLLLLAPASAQVNREYVSATGEARLKTPPDIVELFGRVTGSAETASDAATKFFGVKKEVEDSLKDLGIQGLKIKAGGLGVGSPVESGRIQIANPFQPQPAAPAATVQLHEVMVVRVEGIDKLKEDALVSMISKVIDSATSAGLKFGGVPLTPYELNTYSRGGNSSFAVFKSSKIKSVRREATRLAVLDAKARAKELAMFGDVALGRVASINMGAAVPGYTSLSRAPVPGTSLSAKPIEVVARVTVYYRVKE